MKESKEFLSFNGHNLHFSLVDGEWWFALKPICDALNVNWNRQFQNIKKDKILVSAFAKQQMQVLNDQPRPMVCLPEFFVYGWLFQIRSESEELSKYKWECYRILYDHFKGTITKRKEMLKEAFNIDSRLNVLVQKLMEYPEYTEMIDLKKRKSHCTKTLNKMDKDIVHEFGEQGDLFN